MGQRRPKLTMLGVIFFFHFYANVQHNVTYGILHNDEFDYAKRDSCLAAYGGVVLQRFEHS